MASKLLMAEYGLIREMVQEAEKALEDCKRSKAVSFSALILSKALESAAERAEWVASCYSPSIGERAAPMSPENELH